jgi:hypothetical protein
MGMTPARVMPRKQSAMQRMYLMVACTKEKEVVSLFTQLNCCTTPNKMTGELRDANTHVLFASYALFRRLCEVSRFACLFLAIIILSLGRVKYSEADVELHAMVERAALGALILAVVVGVVDVFCSEIMFKGLHSLIQDKVCNTQVLADEDFSSDIEAK